MFKIVSMFSDMSDSTASMIPVYRPCLPVDLHEQLHIKMSPQIAVVFTSRLLLLVDKSLQYRLSSQVYFHCDFYQVFMLSNAWLSHLVLGCPISLQNLILMPFSVSLFFLYMIILL